MASNQQIHNQSLISFKTQQIVLNFNTINSYGVNFTAHAQPH